MGKSQDEEGKTDEKCGLLHIDFWYFNVLYPVNHWWKLVLELI